MFQKLVSHNDDIRQLLEKGYALAVDSNCLVIRDIPYLDDGGHLQHGAIVTKLQFIDQVRVQQTNHQVFFAGSHPHSIDGQPIPNLSPKSQTIQLSDACADVTVQYALSNKPRKQGAFKDFYEKIESYVSIISGPAMELHKASPYTFRSVQTTHFDPVFRFHDTLTTRAEINDLSDKLRNDIVAVIGLGGTGGYVLDFLSKTPIPEIRAFDLDLLTGS